MFTITIEKWSEFQPRKDRAKHTWFRVDKDIMTSESLDGLAPDQKWLWICLLAKACKAESPTFDLNMSYFVKHTGISEKRIREALDFFRATGAISLGNETPDEAENLSGNQSVSGGNRAGSNGITTYVRTNVQTDVEAAAEPILKTDSKTAEYLSRVKPEVQEHWLAVYPDKTWVEAEIQAAVTWCLANSQKAPKSEFARFFTSWLKRGWETHRTKGKAPTVRTPPRRDQALKIDPTHETPVHEREIANENREAAAAKVRELLNMFPNLGGPKAGAS